MKTNWQPTATIETLCLRAKLIADLREFFRQRDVLEVETPVLGSHTVTDPHIHSICAQYDILSDSNSKTLYLQTSPEFYMKRLLAAGSGAIFQIGKTFRADEMGSQHRPEFTLLEWYRPGFDHHQLMDEVDTLLQSILAVGKAVRQTYADLFQRTLDIDPHIANSQQLQACAMQQGLTSAQHLKLDSKDEWLDLLLSHLIIPKLDQDTPLFIYDFPTSQAALAKIVPHSPPVAARFEVYLAGIELANGFDELTDPIEQRKRFEADNHKRAKKGLRLIALDECFLQALTAGLPSCAGVALGVDRLLMLVAGQPSIEKVLAFADF